jgi:hypothetical protein
MCVAAAADNAGVWSAMRALWTPHARTASAPVPLLRCVRCCWRVQVRDAPMDIDAAPSAKRRQCTVTGEVLMRLPSRRIDIGSVGESPWSV